VLLALNASPALASGECGSTTASWNAPNGAVVFNRGPGPILNVMDAIGEYRTHSMLSHGPGNGVSHATMRTPRQRSWPGVCSLPINTNDLQYGYPGLEQINQGGIYQYLYADPSSTQWIGYQLGDPAQAAIVADTAWYNYPVEVDTSSIDSSQTIRRPLRNGAEVNYSLFQYRNLESSNQVPSNSVNNGLVCSTFLAYMHDYSGRGYVTPYTYSHSLIAAAASQLYTGVYNACKQSLGWFEGAVLTVACPFYNVCGNAGNQVANCMSTNTCNSSNASIWQSVSNDPSTVATSISPDRIGGWGVHPWNTTLWAPDYNHDIQWNAGGNVYGCWQ
jgi:hypothetical protein